LAIERRSTAVRAEVSPLIDSGGKLEGAIVLLHDLSYQKGVEQALDADRNPFRLSPAGLAHEIKNPLTGIKGAGELLSSMFPADQRAQQYCKLILDGANRITSLIEQVLAASGPQRLKHEPVNVHQLLHQALRMAGIQGERPGIVVQQLLDPSLPELEGDAAALERVFLNLVRNSLEAIEAASAFCERSGNGQPVSQSTPVTHVIRLRTAMETQFRLSTLGRRRQFLRVEISDSGIGLSADEIKQLFTPFFTTKPAGTGLGLVLSQRIIALHGGKLWAEAGGVEPLPGIDSIPGTVPALSKGAAVSAEPTRVQGHSGRSDRSKARGMTFCVLLPVGSKPA
jgi:nitrogen-specific signal transduction histidine kinase